jgi:hypothetical protein
MLLNKISFVNPSKLPLVFTMMKSETERQNNTNLASNSFFNLFLSYLSDKTANNPYVSITNKPSQ